MVSTSKLTPKNDAQEMLVNIDKYLKSIGAVNVADLPPKDPNEGKYTMRPLTAEELEKYNAQKAANEEAMAKWQAEREIEMEKEGGDSWKLLCELRAKEQEKKDKGITGPALITKATSWGPAGSWKIE